MKPKYVEIDDYALEFATKKHEGQFRKDGKTPYVSHPKRVAELVRKYVRANGKDYDLTSFGMGRSMVAAMYLHDTVEDCGVTIKEIREEFGPDIAILVDWMTNKTHGMKAPRADRKRLDRERLAKAPKEAKIIKMLDRIDNLSDGGGMDMDFKRKYVKESLLLVEVLRDADEELAKELIAAAEKFAT